MVESSLSPAPRRRRLSFVVAGLAAALITAACGGGPSNESSAGDETKQQGKTSAFPVTIAQKVAPVTIEKEPTRVIALDFPSADAALSAQSAAAGLARLVGVINLPRDEHRPEPAALVDHSVAIEDASFAYQAGHPVLDGVSLRIEPGETVALVGASGAGKSTLAKLVAGIHQPTTGRVLLGGRTHDELSGEAVGRAVVLLTQDVHVFAGPLAADLRLARPDAGDDELVAALDLVGALSWVEALPDRLDTVVGEGGHRLSATQAQQIALARVVLVDAPVVILDEATADAGSAGARALEAAARRVLAGRTAVVVAHRLTQAAAADRVVVLDRGRLVEVGTHDELLSSGGTYAQLWQAWSAGRATSPTKTGATP